MLIKISTQQLHQPSFRIPFLSLFFSHSLTHTLSLSLSLTHSLSLSLTHSLPLLDSQLKSPGPCEWRLENGNRQNYKRSRSQFILLTIREQFVSCSSALTSPQIQAQQRLDINRVQCGPSGLRSRFVYFVILAGAVG